MNKYVIWRHENALGNSAEHCINLSNLIQENNDYNCKIYVEKDFQKYFAMCIPGVNFENILFLDKNYDLDNLIYNYKQYDDISDIIFPNVYFNSGYPSSWKDLQKLKFYLKFPQNHYQNKHNLPKDVILMQFRESNTFWKRIDGSNSEPERDVNIEIFFKLSLYYADLGYTVVRIGDSNQTLMPKHNNIIDFTRFKNTNMLDDLYLLNNSKVFISTDSGIWPMAGGLKKNLVLTNVASVYQGTNYIKKPEIINWLNNEITEVLLKKIENEKYVDNTFEEIVNATKRFL